MLDLLLLAAAPPPALPLIAWAALPRKPRRDAGSRAELFGDEKRPDALLTTQVFAPERLTLGQLRCMEVHPPFVYQRIGAGPDALVIENHHTFVSFARALPPDGPVGVLIYGAGGHFKGSVTYAADLMPRPTRILYFGDIDPDGLDIPAYASRVATEHDLPAVQPAAALYRLLLDHGRPLPGGGAGRRVSVERSVAWLPDDLRGAAGGGRCSVTASGSRKSGSGRSFWRHSVTCSRSSERFSS